MKLGGKEQQMIKLAAPTQLEAVSCYKPEWRFSISDKRRGLFFESTTKKKHVWERAVSATVPPASVLKGVV